MGNSSLHTAKRNRYDELYTLLPDIEKEIKNYPGAFEGKTIYCNCDDPFKSNFYKFFAREFSNLGLKSLICSCYRSQERLLFGEPNPPAIWVEYTGGREGIPDPNDLGVHTFRGDGDFRSDESIELLKRADIVVTNPPFSLMRDYIDQLMEFGKKFLIIGPLTTLSYSNVFPHVKKGKIWGGGGRTFINAETKELELHCNTHWITNLENDIHNTWKELQRRYTPEAFPRYDTIDAIDVPKVADIPGDYPGPMGVPLTFLFRYNPEQFEIISRPNNTTIQGKNTFLRIIIRNKHPLGEHPAGAEERKESGLLWETTTQE